MQRADALLTTGWARSFGSPKIWIPALIVNICPCSAMHDLSFGQRESETGREPGAADCRAVRPLGASLLLHSPGRNGCMIAVNWRSETFIRGPGVILCCPDLTPFFKRAARLQPSLLFDEDDHSMRQRFPCGPNQSAANLVTGAPVDVFEGGCPEKLFWP